MHYKLLVSLQVDAASNYVSGLGEELMMWPPNSWKTGGRQKMLPHVKKASDAQVLNDFLNSGLHDELGLGCSDDTGDGWRTQFCGKCGCPGHNR